MLIPAVGVGIHFIGAGLVDGDHSLLLDRPLARPYIIYLLPSSIPSSHLLPPSPPPSSKKHISLHMDSPNLANPFSLINVPHEILVEIALETALIDVLGPPSHLLALLCTCRRIYNQLARSTDLLGRIFRAKFDVSAIRRRFGPLGLHNKNLASQLKVYCSTMRRIREGDIHSENLEQDLWIAYFMLSENDGRNAIQLREWANIFPFVDRIVRTRLYEDAPQTGWPLENVRNNLAMWILWFVTDIGVFLFQVLSVSFIITIILHCHH